jgi:anti-sigma factor RsiW
MSEHAWTLENIAAFVAGGLDPAEAERLERHAAECPECAAMLREGRTLDGGLSALFATAQPGPALEDRMIQSLRMQAAGQVLRSRWRRKLAFGAAAAVALGVTGAGMSRLVDADGLPFPGLPIAKNNLKQMMFASTALDDALSKEEVAQSRREAADAAQMAREAAERALSQLNGVAPKNEHFSELVKENDSIKLHQNQPASPHALAFAPDGVSATMGERGFKGRLWDARSGKSGDDYSAVAEFFPPRETPSNKGNQSGDRGDAKGSGQDDHDKGKEQQPGSSKAEPPDRGEPKGGSKGDPNQGEGQPRPPAQDAGKPDKPAPPKPEPPPEEAPAARKVIRTGDIEFEVESFDSALAAVTKLVTAIKGAYVGTVNSDKLANGKVKGSIVVRVPPDSLDSLVLDLRKELGKGGELKGQRIASQDVTKQYTDLESRLKAARTMEQRLLQIIKEGKGEIKQLLEAEKELGVWRTKIEEFEGEIRYYANQVSLSTLTITLAEKDVRAAADVVESERVSAGLEVDDVDKAQREALAAVAEAKGRVTRSELKQHSAGQFSAVLQFEVAPDAAGPLRDRLKQLGNMVRLEIGRVQQAEGGTAPPPAGAKVRRGETRFDVQLYNLAKVEPRETATVRLVAADVPAAYRKLRDAVERAKGRVVTAQLNEHDRQNVTAQLDFDVRRAEEPAVLAALAAAGDVLSREVSRAPESPNLTDAKVLFKTSLTSAASAAPRETFTLGIEVADVDATAAVFAAQVADVQGRTVQAQLTHERSGRVTGKLTYDVPLAAAPGLVARFKDAGAVRVHDSTRQPQADEGKLALARLDVTLSNADLIVPHDDGLWPQVRKGLSYSVAVLSLSVTWLIFGLCVVLPWAVVGYGGYRLVRRLFRAPTPPPVQAP